MSTASSACSAVSPDEGRLSAPKEALLASRRIGGSTGHSDHPAQVSGRLYNVSVMVAAHL